MLASLYTSSSTSAYTSSMTQAASKAATTGIVLLVFLILGLVLGLVGGIALYFTFLSKKNDGKFNGFLGWMYDALVFKKMLVETILKVTYLVAAIFITIFSFGLIAVNFWSFLGLLIFGNLGLRMTYEFALMSVLTCRNTSDINSTLKKMAGEKEEKAEPVVPTQE